MAGATAKSGTDRHAAAVRLPAGPIDAIAVLAALGSQEGAFLRLAQGRVGRAARWSYLAHAPAECLVAAAWPAGESLQQRLAPLALPPAGRARGLPPFAGGWTGMIGYEARSGVERSPARRRAPASFPVLHLARHEEVLALPKGNDSALAVATASSPSVARSRAAAFARRLRSVLRAVGPPSRAADEDRREVRGPPPRAAWSQREHEAAVERARRAVRRGDIFQTNISQRFEAKTFGTPIEAFRRLARSLPAPHMTYVDVGGGRAVLSASPERFLRLVGRRLESEPMKGTRPRGTDRRQDVALRAELAASRKDRAELAMIVDLVRNDLTRTCRPGSIRVVDPRRIVSFARVHQAIAVVRGTLRQDQTRIGALAAAFPPGSVTGAPKVRAMEILDEIEGEGRGAYCGALGWFDDRGDMDLAVAIRTILWSRNRATYRVGGGITLGSEPTAEWRETLVKGRGLYHALAGFEDPT